MASRKRGRSEYESSMLAAKDDEICALKAALKAVGKARARSDAAVEAERKARARSDAAVEAERNARARSDAALAVERKERAEESMLNKVENVAKLDAESTVGQEDCNQFTKQVDLSSPWFAVMLKAEPAAINSVWKAVRSCVRLPKPTDGEIPFYHDAIKQVLLCADPLIHADHQIMPECMPSHVPAVSEKADEYTPALEKTKPPAAKRARLDAVAVESTPKTSRKRCDFVMTFAYDANASLRSMLLSLDVKRVLHKAIKATTPASGAGSKTVAGPSTIGGNKICEGIAQAKKYAAIVLLHLYNTRATDHKVLRTYAAFTNCYAICFICAEISHIGTSQVKFTLYQTSLMPFLVDAIPAEWQDYAVKPKITIKSFSAGPTSLPKMAKKAPSGFKFLAGMLSTSAEALGAIPLPTPELRVLGESTELTSLVLETQLGRGGFGNVFQSMYNTEPVAVKVSRSQFDESLKNEEAILSKLKEVNIKGLFQRTVFSTQASFLGYTGLVPALVTSPVGTPLSQYIRSGELDVHKTAAKVCNDVLAAVKEAHSVGIVHGDIRPANVIALHSDATETTFMLIDWGSGHALRTASVPKQKGPISHPENAQFKKGATGRFEDVDVRSKLGDLLSVLYLYCAIMYANDTSTLAALAERDTSVALFLAAPTYVWPEGVVLTSLPELPTAKSRMPASAPTALPATSLFVRRQNPRG
jgi:hypothetical protein